MARGKLNRIQHRTLPQVQLALMLVGYDQGVQEVIEYVFGSTLVCESLEVVCMLMLESGSHSSCCKRRLRLSWK